MRSPGVAVTVIDLPHSSGASVSCGATASMKKTIQGLPVWDM